MLYTTLWMMALQKLNIKHISFCAHMTNYPQHCTTTFIRPFVHLHQQACKMGKPKAIVEKSRKLLEKNCLRAD